MNETTTQETLNVEGLPLPRRHSVIVPFYIESVLRLLVQVTGTAHCLCRESAELCDFAV